MVKNFSLYDTTEFVEQEEKYCPVMTVCYQDYGAGDEDLFPCISL